MVISRLIVATGLALSLAITLSLPARARADVGALLEPLSEAGVPDRDRWAARQAVQVYFSELDQPVPLTTPEEGRKRAGAALRDCAEPSCAADYAKALGVDFAVIVRLFSRDRGGGTGSLSVAIVTLEGLAYAASVPVAENNVTGAIFEGLSLASERRVRGPGPWLRADAADGASVYIDGKPVGLVPLYTRITPGLHKIDVKTLEGKLLHSTAITIPDDPLHYQNLEVPPDAVAVPAPDVSAEASADTEASPSKGVGARERSVWNYVIGGAAIAVGGVYTVGSTLTLMRDGETTGDEMYRAGVKTKVLLGVGIAGVLGGTALCVFSPIRVRVSVDETHAAVLFDHRF